MTPAGQLNRRVQVQLRTVTRDLTNDEVEAWATVRTLSMGYRVARGGQRFAELQVVSEIACVFTARWFPAAQDFAPETHRLVYRGRVYRIHAMVESDRRDEIEFHCAARGERVLEPSE